MIQRRQANGVSPWECAMFFLTLRLPPRKVEVKNSKLHGSEFELEDGTIMKVQPVLLEIQRLAGEYDDEGKPRYSMQIAFNLIQNSDAFKVPPGQGKGHT